MDKETILAIVGLLTAVAGAVRWLISVYWAQAEKIEDLRHKNERHTIISMKDGQGYFDTDLGTSGLPIWYDGTNWIDASGNTV